MPERKGVTYRHTFSLMELMRLLGQFYWSTPAAVATTVAVLDADHRRPIRIKTTYSDLAAVNMGRKELNRHV